jgi:hypothetical protein
MTENNHPMLNRKTYSKIALPEEEGDSPIHIPSLNQPTDMKSILRAFLSRVKFFHLAFWGLNVLILAFLLYDTPIETPSYQVPTETGNSMGPK